MMRNQPYFNTIRLIPGMNFTCRGRITGVTVAGELRDGSQGMKLHIWERDGNKSGIYQNCGHKVLLSPDMCEYDNSTKIFDCWLPRMMQISVEPGGILGIELPRRNEADFELYSVSEPGLTNYIFKRNLPSTVDLHSRINEIPSLLPLIRIKVNSAGIQASYLIILCSHNHSCGYNDILGAPMGQPPSLSLCPTLESTLASPLSTPSSFKGMQHSLIKSCRIY